MKFKIKGFYLAEKVFENKTSAVFRGTRLQDNVPVIITFLNKEYPSLTELKEFDRVNRIIEELDLPGIIKLFSIEDVGYSKARVYEDIGAVTLKRYIATRPIGLWDFLTIAIRITDILGQVHCKNVFHQRIHPGNILIRPNDREIRIAGFGKACYRNVENSFDISDKWLEGNLAYISPEQTGRMKIPVDYRTDFYSLGVLFYEMLTGQLPFEHKDPAEISHAHMARQPIPLHLVSDIPITISNIVLKLLSKNAANRYNTAAGLKYDLKECLKQLQQGGNIETFDIGKKDVSDRIQIPGILYGREREIDSILEAYFETIKGETKTIFISGPPGIGKTRMIDEIKARVIKHKSLFISGKFDQLMQDIPYEALINALQKLIRFILTLPIDELKKIRNSIKEAIAPNGQILIEVIPELESLIGKQQTIPKLAPLESINRFNLTFMNFISVFTQTGPPLVIFIDDLQWADAATLDLLEILSTGLKSRYLFLICAYRNTNEDESRENLKILRRIKKDLKHNSVSITPKPLKNRDISKLLHDTLKCDVGKSQELVRLIKQKTAGNPFFIYQFLQVLNDENVLVFDQTKSKWTCRTDDVRNVKASDNVIELMLKQIGELPHNTIEALSVGSCIGNRFDIKTIANLTGYPEAKIVRFLTPAIHRGLIHPLGKTISLSVNKPIYKTHSIKYTTDYFFIHDRIQQGIYSKLATSKRIRTHLSIGQFLQKNMSESEVEENLFSIVQQLNSGRQILETDQDKIGLAELNLKACKKAKSSAAFKSALSLAEMGIRLLPEKHWEQHYDLSIQLFKEAAEAEHLNGNFDQARRLYTEALSYAKSDTEKAFIYSEQIYLHTTQTKFLEATELIVEGLNMLGVYIPESDDELRQLLFQELNILNDTFTELEVGQLSNLPKMTDLRCIAILQVISGSGENALMTLGKHALLAYLICKSINLILKHGNCEFSVNMFISYSIVLTQYQDFKQASEFADLALTLSDSYANSFNRCTVFFKYAVLIHHWSHTLESGDRYFEIALQASKESGNFEMTGYILVNHFYSKLYRGENISVIYKELLDRSAYFECIKKTIFQDQPLYILTKQHIKNLLGITNHICSLNDNGFNERDFVKKYKSPLILCMFYSVKMTILYSYNENKNVLNLADKTMENLDSLGTFLSVPHIYFQVALVYLRACSIESKQCVPDLMKKAEDIQAKLEVWDQHYAPNFSPMILLIKAEKARIQETGNAGELYVQAIEAARKSKFVRIQALASELAAKYHLPKGDRLKAGFYLNECHYLCDLMGFITKIEVLKREYPEGYLLGNTNIALAGISSWGQGVLPSIKPDLPAFDIDSDTVIKASQAISMEIVPDKLISKLLRIMLENAGAEKGVFLVNREKGLYIEAECRSQGSTVDFYKSLNFVKSNGIVPNSIIAYVDRVRDLLVLNDAMNETAYSDDEYIRKNKVKSILCLPVMHKSKMTAILYLENNFVCGAFTRERWEMLLILSAQAAISIENAYLYEDLSKEITVRKQAESALIENEQKYRNLFENTKTPSLIVKDDLTIEMSNPKFELLTGYSREEVEGKMKLIDFIVPEERKNILNLHRKANRKTNLSEMTYEIKLQNRSGGIGYYLAEVSLHTEAENSIISLVDISAQKEAEERLRKREQILRNENIRLRSSLRKPDRLGDIVGKSRLMQDIFDQILEVASTDANVIVHGESGTGKELVAKVIHDLSARRDKRLVSVNCGAIPEWLLESEFFGHKKGAFTGATSDKPGYLDMTNKGTLFLDEIGELDLNLQTKLLRVIDGTGYIPVGGYEIKQSDVRFICATNRDLKEQVKNGHMRMDFFFRIYIIPIILPPLRDHKEDIPILLEHFLRAYGKINEFARLSPKVIEAFQAYHWPGNVRELQNALLRFVTFGKLDFACNSPVDPAHSNDEMQEYANETTPLNIVMKEYEKKYIQKILEKNNGNKTKTASVLGLSLRTFYRKMQNCEIV